MTLKSQIPAALLDLNTLTLRQHLKKQIITVDLHFTPISIHQSTPLPGPNIKINTCGNIRAYRYVKEITTLHSTK